MAFIICFKYRSGYLFFIQTSGRGMPHLEMMSKPVMGCISYRVSHKVPTHAYLYSYRKVFENP